MVLPVIPGLLDDIFPAIVVMEQRGVKPDAVQLDRVAPRAPNILRRGQVVGHVFKGAFRDLHIGIHQPELPIGPGERRRPNAAGGGVALHVQQGGGGERRRQQVPVFQVFRLM